MPLLGAISCTMMPSSRSPLADFTPPDGPPSSLLPACAGRAARQIVNATANSEPIVVRGVAMALSCSARVILRIGRGTVRIPAAPLPQIAHEIVQVGVAQN